MKSTGALLVGLMLVGLAGCSDSIVGTDEDLASAAFKKGGGKGPPGGRDPGEWPMTVTFADRAGDQIRSEGELRPDLTDLSYSDGECGVMAKIGNLDDALFDPDWSYKKRDARNCGAARVQVFEFDDRPARTDLGAFMNIDGLCSMAVAEVRTDTRAQFNVCGTLVYADTTIAAEDGPRQLAGVRAERTGQTTWKVTADGPAAEAYCTGGEGAFQSMPFQLTITAQPDPSTVCPVGP